MDFTSYALLKEATLKENRRSTDSAARESAHSKDPRKAVGSSMLEPLIPSISLALDEKSWSFDAHVIANVRFYVHRFHFSFGVWCSFGYWLDAI